MKFNLRPLCFGMACLMTIGLSGWAQEKPLQEQMPRIPPRTPDEALSTFRLQHGFTLELVAAEPLVADPIDAAFDEHNRLYVVEMSDYPFLPEQRAPRYRMQRAETFSRIRLLTDTDNDGRMDHSTVFADRLRWAQSVCCSRGGIYVLAPPDLLYLKDTDGDGAADQRDVVCTGFSQGNVQGLANGLEWGRDNAIYFSSGLAGGELTIAATARTPLRTLTPGRRDLRLDPATGEITPVAGGQQFGHTIDDFGERFICSNSSHIVHVIWPLPYLERNPQLTMPTLTRPIAREGAAAVVFRTSAAEPWRLVRTARRAADPAFAKRLPPTELVPTGFFTSATGITVYRGGAFPPEFHGNVFIGDVGGNLVHRKRLTPDGISYLAERTEPDCEFLTSTDNWFRPANFVNAPDGTLYMLDMYRETIEHPASIPEDIKELCDLESGYDKGRIWRIAPPGWKRPLEGVRDLGRATTLERVDALLSPHGAVRDMAQRLLVEEQNKSAIDPLRSLTASSLPWIPTRREGVSSVARLHAAWALKGLGALNETDVLGLLYDPDPRVQAHGIRLYEETRGDRCLERLSEVLAAGSVRLRWQWALTLGQLEARQAVPGLKSLAKAAATDPDLRTAWLSSVQPHMVPLLIELTAQDSGAILPLLRDLAQLIGSSSAAPAIVQVIAGQDPSMPELVRWGVLSALGEGLRRRGLSILTVLEEQKREDLAAMLKREMESAAGRARDTAPSLTVRTAAVEFLALAEAGYQEQVLPELLTPQTPPELQQRAIRALIGGGRPQSLERVLAGWKGFAPGLRRDIVDQLVTSPAGAARLVEYLATGQILSSEIERDKRQLLMIHPVVAVRESARKVLEESTGNRRQVVAEYQGVLDLEGDATRGRQFYAKTCIQCHRTGQEGHAVGPDLASVQNKSAADLIVAILDPNREAQPSFQTYTAVTRQGTVHNGIIAAETSASLTLRRAESREDVLLRETLEELISTGQSLMPEGMEKDLNPQALADVIAFIKAQAPAK